MSTLDTIEEENTLTDEEANVFIEHIKQMSIYEEMSDEDDNSDDGNEKKNIWSSIIVNITSIINNFRSFF